MSERFPVLKLHQFASSTEDDVLYMFSAPAKKLVDWAGIPRKGWKIRMLYQRWVTPGRSRDVTRFWNDAAEYRGADRNFLLGPTALTLAGLDPLDIDENGIALGYKPPFELLDSADVMLQNSAITALSRMVARLDAEERELLDECDSFFDEFAEKYRENHVLQSAIQISQIAEDPGRFRSHHKLGLEDERELLIALESLCRPALVVDGQHRLLGAANSRHDIFLPVVLIPNANWLEQIYQFVVINETAQRVKSELLTDIFGNSLTPDEQTEVRSWLAKSHVDVESRIAAVVAGNHNESPFRGLVRLELAGKKQGFITETTIRQLIDGGRGGTPGWRNDPGFYDKYVAKTIAVQEDWSGWTDGVWREYWFAFWDEVGKFYNSDSVEKLWGPVQTNLTKAVSLRLIQELFMEHAVESAESANRASESVRTALTGRMSEEEIELIVNEEQSKGALPSDLTNFRIFVREDFLGRGIPVRVFEREWVSSLDDQSGISELRLELRKAFDTTRRGDRYRAQNKAVYALTNSD